MKNKKKLFVIAFMAFLVLIILFFYFNAYNNSKIVNNINKSNIKEYILSISSYEAEISVNINSNKNSNKYIIKQKHDKVNHTFSQEVIEPSNIKGLKTTYDGKTLTLENTSLNLNSMYENYEYILNNSLDLISFLETYKNTNDAEYIENENEVVLKIKNEKANIYNYFQRLYIDKKTGKPLRMEIQDKNQNLVVYIVYNEINFKNTKNDEIMAFAIEGIDKNL